MKPIKNMSQPINHENQRKWPINQEKTTPPDPGTKPTLLENCTDIFEHDSEIKPSVGA